MKIISILLLFMGCTTPTPLTDNLYRVGYKAVKIVERELPLKCEGIGRMVHEGKISTFNVNFLYSKPFTIEHGRCVMLNSIQISLNTFQSDAEIQKYLLDGSFSINNLIIFFYSQLYDFSEAPPGQLSGLVFDKGIIEYRRYNPTTKKLETIYEETYEEALQKCEGAL